MARSLNFLQHTRQDYSPQVEPHGCDDFIVSDGEGSEFLLVIQDLRRVGGGISPQLRVFDDGLPALRKFISMGGMKQLGDVELPDDLAHRLLALGIADRSDKPLRTGGPRR